MGTALLRVPRGGERNGSAHIPLNSIAHLVAFDDGPFAPAHRGDVPLIGAVFSGLRLDGVLRGRVRRDGANASRVIAELVGGSRFRAHLQAVLLQGIAVAGFNVVDIHWVRVELGLPVIVAMRRRPDLEAVRQALLSKVPGGRRKWHLIERAGPVEPAGEIFIQRAGIPHQAAAELVARLAVNSRVPEPLRTAHLIAAALGAVPSAQRV